MVHSIFWEAGGKEVNPMIQKVRNFYAHLGDEESREIFEKRLLYSLTGDRRYITEIVKATELYQKVSDLLRQDKNKKYIVGAGQWGKIMADLFREDGIEGLLDNYASGTYNGLPILPMKEFLQSTSGVSAYIASTAFHKELCAAAQAGGVKQENVIDVAGMMLQVYHEQQYFDLPCLERYREPHEIFVDGGCYDGANSVRFVQWAGESEKTVYAFEADERNAGKCKSVLGQIEGADCHLITKGMWSGDTVLSFCSKANEASGLAENGQQQVSVTSLDSAVEGKVTFIKMDIEGAEYEALRGAKNIISSYHPKLAVSIYHKDEDIWEIPQLILSFYANYKFYLRHYSLSSEETVLYAVPEG